MRAFYKPFSGDHSGADQFFSVVPGGELSRRNPLLKLFEDYVQSSRLPIEGSRLEGLPVSNSHQIISGLPQSQCTVGAHPMQLLFRDKQSGPV